MIAVELWSVDAEELEQVLKLSLAVVCGRHAGRGRQVRVAAVDRRRTMIAR